MPTYPNIPLTVPTVGGSSGTWGQLLLDCLLALDQHRHEGIGAGGAKIQPAGIDINDDLSLASNSLTNIRSLAFSSGQAVSGSRLLYVGADNELYWNNNASGAAIKITDGASLNVAGFIGGIGGDYTAVAAELNYDDALDRYTFTMAGGTTWARIAAGELRIHEHNTIANSYVALASPSGLAGSYTLTFPGALPGSTQLAQVSSAGVMSFSNTVAQAVTLSGGVSGATTFSGVITASSGVTSPTAITAADFKHTANHVVPLAASAAIDVAGSHTRSTGASGAANRYQIAASTNVIMWPLPLRELDRITEFSVWVRKETDGTNTITARLYRTNGTDGTETALGSGVSSSGNGPGFIILTENGLSIDLDEDHQYYLVFTPGGGVSPGADILYHATVYYTRPA